MEAAIKQVHDMGYELGKDCCAIQNYKGYLCYYGPGEVTGGTGGETWSLKAGAQPAYFKVNHTPKTKLGPHLPGSPMKPQGSWPGSIEAAMKIVQEKGHVLGGDCAAIQNYKNYLCYYGPGEESGKGGEEIW